MSGRCVADILYQQHESDNKNDWCIIPMFYLTFFVSNYVSLGIGVWVAIRHGELLRHQKNDAIWQAQKKELTQKILPDDTQNDADMTQHSNDDSVDSDTDHSIGSDVAWEAPTPVSSDRNVMDHQPRLETNRAEERLPPNERLRLDNGKPSVAKPLFTGDMIEQLVGMEKVEMAKELAPIMTQLQEIHDMATTTDNHYCASEDADFFITPDRQQYATTTICRPMVGQKRASVN